MLTQAGLFAGAGFGLSQLNAVTKFLPTLIGQFTNLGAVLSGTMGIASGILPILLAVGVAIFGIVEAVKAYKAAHPDLETLGQQFKDEKEAIDDTKKSLQEVKNDLDKLNNTPVSDKSSHWVEETERLKNLCLYYEYLLQMQEKEASETTQKYRTSDKDAGYVVKGSRTTAGIQGSAAFKQTYGSEAEAIYAMANELNLVPKNASNAEEALDSLRKQLHGLGIQINAVKISAEEYNNQQADAINSFLNETNATKELTSAQQERQRALLADNQIMYQVLAASTNLNASEFALKTAYEQLAISVASANGSIDDSYQIIANLANMLGFTPQQAYEFAISMGAIDSAVRPLPGAFQQLADGTWVVVDALGGAADSINGLAGASYTGSDAAFQMAQNLLTAANQVDTTSRAFYDLVAQEIIFNNTGINVSQQIAALQALALQAGATADAIANVTYHGNTTKTKVRNPETGELEWSFSGGTKSDQQSALVDYYKNLTALAPTKTEQTPTTYGGDGGGSVQKAKDEIEKNAQSTLNNISSMTSQTIDDAAKEAQEKAKKTLDAIKKAVKEFYDERINALKEQNEEIDKQVQLEEKLKALEEAKNKQILLYENGEYHYGQDLGAIAAAQKDYDKFVADMERDEQIGVLEDTRDKILKVLEQIESNLENYTETQLSSIGNLSTSVTSSIENITNIIGDTSSGIFAALQGLLSGVDASGSLDLSALMSMFGGGGSGSSTSSAGGNLLAGTYEELVAHGGNVGYKLREAWGQSISQDEIDRLMGLKLSSERDWKQGQFLSLAYKADTDIPLDVQWWMSIFEAEMSDIIRGYTGNIGGGADPRGLDPDAAKHVDIQYWLDAITNAKDMYEAMDYYARAVASGYVLAEFADGYFDALGYKNFDPKTIKQDMRNAYSNMYINNPDAVLMTRFKQYYSDPQLARGNAAESAWYFNQNDFLNDLLYSQLTAEQVWKYGGDTARSAYYDLEGKPLSETESWQQENAEAIAARNRQYLLDELYRQIELNSAAWFEATEAEKDAYHRANEYYRDIVNRIESGNYEGLGGWMPSAASPYMQGILNDQNGKGKHYDSVIDFINSPGQSYTGDVVMIRNGEVIAPAEDVIPEIAESLGIPTDYGTTTGVAAQGSILEDLGSNGTTNYNINIDNIELPGVVDSNGFISGLRNLAYQYAYTRQ
ncbi:MAG: hypothetical protein IJA72_03185 [Clostridia bacterium]|nr:hypothetical protein [Clostridia bacterium]